jgi:N-acyl-L-homoserine lactone synthetase
MIEIAQSPKQLSEVYRLRHQVYCLERGFEPAEGSEETDEFDGRSRHVLLREPTDGQVVGTVRIIAPDRANLAASFPIQRLCEPELLQALPLATAGEISRFAISKQRRGRKAEMLTRLALMRGIAQLSSEMGLTHWLAVMERGLMRLQHRNWIHFEPLGPLVSYHGVRQPAVGEIATVINRIRREEFTTWSYLTDGGRWCARPEEEAPKADQDEDRCEDPGGRVPSPDPRHMTGIPRPGILG